MGKLMFCFVLVCIGTSGEAAERKAPQLVYSGLASELPKFKDQRGGIWIGPLKAPQGVVGYATWHSALLLCNSLKARLPVKDDCILNAPYLNHGLEGQRENYWLDDWTRSTPSAPYFCSVGATVFDRNWHHDGKEKIVYCIQN